MKIDLELIARTKYKEPMSTWPSHENEKDHLSTSFEGRIFDGKCLRCWIERITQEEILGTKTAETSSVSSDEPKTYTTYKTTFDDEKLNKEIDNMWKDVDKVFEESRKIFDKVHKTTSGIWKTIRNEMDNPKNGNK